MGASELEGKNKNYALTSSQPKKKKSNQNNKIKLN